MEIDGFERFRVVSFDCYGTLIDWEAGILSAMKVLLASRGLFPAEGEILARYAEYESEAESSAHLPYREVLREVVRRFGAAYGFAPDAGEQECLDRALPHWRPFDDTVGALHRLHTRFQLAVLSNVDDDLFAATRERLGVAFDHVVTAGQVGAYKPSPAMFEALIRRTTGDPGSILHVAQSIYHDVVPGKAAGLTTVWVRRRSPRADFGATPAATARPDVQVPDLDTLATLAGV
jgi:2-haloacid dehalogenase